ncbi:hypothetical protein BH18ACT13_BH18ACT13_07570 [soil metagenome]
MQAAGYPVDSPLLLMEHLLARSARWLLGTHRGAVRAHQLDSYLDEFTFRFNRRSSRQCSLLFYRPFEQAVQVDHVPAGEIKGRP